MAKQELATTDAEKAPILASGEVKALVPTTSVEVGRIAKMISESGMAPKDMATPQKIATAIMHGLEVGLKPMQAVQSIAVVNGRPSLWGDGAMGLVHGSGLLDDFEETITGEGDDMVAICRAKRRDRTTEIKRSFSVKDARKAGLWDKSGPWKQYPKRMLQMRARSWVLRDGFADVLKGLQIREEVRDIMRPVLDQASPTVTANAIKAQADLPEPGPEVIDVETEDVADLEPMTEEEQELLAEIVAEMSRVSGVEAVDGLLQYKRDEIDACGEALQSAVRGAAMDRIAEINQDQPQGSMI